MAWGEGAHVPDANSGLQKQCRHQPSTTTMEPEEDGVRVPTLEEQTVLTASTSIINQLLR